MQDAVRCLAHSLAARATQIEEVKQQIKAATDSGRYEAIGALAAQVRTASQYTGLH